MGRNLEVFISIDNVITIAVAAFQFLSLQRFEANVFQQPLQRSSTLLVLAGGTEFHAEVSVHFSVFGRKYIELIIRHIGTFQHMTQTVETVVSTADLFDCGNGGAIHFSPGIGGSVGSEIILIIFSISLQREPFVFYLDTIFVVVIFSSFKFCSER